MREIPLHPAGQHLLDRAEIRHGYRSILVGARERQRRSQFAATRKLTHPLEHSWNAAPISFDPVVCVVVIEEK